MNRGIGEYIRPSSLSALEICPGRATMEHRAFQTCPELGRIEHAAAKQGTIGHAVIAQTLSMIYQNPGGRIEISAGLAKMEAMLRSLEPWSADAARRCATYAIALIDQAEKEGFRVVVEVELHLSGRNISIDRGGTADVVLLCYLDGCLEKVIIQDHKLGFLDQGQAYGNLQLLAYSVMAYDRFPGISCVEMHLAQGRLKDFTAAKYSPEALEDGRERIKGAVAICKSDHPPLCPTIEACRYCKALTLCRAVREMIMDASEEMALFGTESSDRAQLMDAAKIASRFSEEAKLLQKEWVKSMEESNGGKQWRT